MRCVKKFTINSNPINKNIMIDEPGARESAFHFTVDLLFIYLFYRPNRSQNN